MENVYILGANRTAIGKFGGSLRKVTSVELGTRVMVETIRRSRINVNDIDQILMGNVLTAGSGPNPARQMGLKAGIPLESAAMTLNRAEGSGLSPIALARCLIRSGDAQIVLGGGVDNMSQAPRLVMETRRGKKLGDLELVDSILQDSLLDGLDGFHIGIAGEWMAKKFGISRLEQDEYAYLSRQKAASAIKAEKFKNEIIPMTFPEASHQAAFLSDEEVSASPSLAELAALPAAFKKNGSITLGNTASLSDGAASFIIVSEKYVRENNLKPLAKIVSSAVVGVAPTEMGTAAVLAARKALKQAHLSVAAIECWEIDEFFAAQTLANIKQLQISPERVNPNGGALALGHPLGAAGARLVVSLLREMRRQNMQYGCAAMCMTGGLGESLIFERDALCSNV